MAAYEIDRCQASLIPWVMNDVASMVSSDVA